MKNFDFFGDPFKMHISGNYTLKSTFGGILSIFTTILMLVYVYFDGSDMFYRKDPHTYQEKQTLNSSHSYNFTNSDFRFYFNLFYGTNKSSFYDPTYIKLKFVTKWRKDRQLIIKNYSLNHCSRESFKNMKDDEYYNSITSRIVSQNYFCPSFDNFTLEGSWVEDMIEYGQIQVYPCNNKTDGVLCKPLKTINDFIWENRIYFSIYYPLTVVRLGNYKLPITYNLKEDYFYIGNLFKYRFMNYAFDKILITTDSGFLFNEESYKEGYAFNLVSFDERNISKDDPYFFSLDFYSSFNLIFYERRYIKLLDIFSNFGGMLQLAITIFSIFVSFFTKLQRAKFMTDKVFIFQDLKSKPANAVLSKSTWEFDVQNKKSKREENSTIINLVNKDENNNCNSKRSKSKDRNQYKDNENIGNLNKLKYNCTCSNICICENKDRSGKHIAFEKYSSSIDCNDKNYGKKNKNEVDNYWKEEVLVGKIIRKDKNKKGKLHKEMELTNINFNKLKTKNQKLKRDSIEKIRKRNKSKSKSKSKIDKPIDLNYIISLEKNLFESNLISNNNINNIDNINSELNNFTDLSLFNSKNKRNLKEYDQNLRSNNININHHTSIDIERSNISKNCHKPNISISQKKERLTVKECIISNNANSASICKDSERDKICDNTFSKNEIFLDNELSKVSGITKNTLKEEFSKQKSRLSKLKLVNNERLMNLFKIKDINDIEIKKNIFVRKLISKKKSDKLKLSCLQKFKFLFLSCIKFSKQKGNDDYKFLMLMKVIDEKLENFFDYLNVIKTIEETSIIKEILLQDHQKIILNILRKETLNIFDTKLFKENNQQKYENDIDNEAIINAVNEMFRTCSLELSAQNSKNPVKLNKNIIEILDGKILFRKGIMNNE